jgi:hypothetical protein
VGERPFPRRDHALFEIGFSRNRQAALRVTTVFPLSKITMNPVAEKTQFNLMAIEGKWKKITRTDTFLA